MLEEKIEKDLKSALLSGDKLKVSTLRTVKSELLNAKVASGKRETGLGDEEVLAIMAKEAKKRQESAEMYQKGGNPAKEQDELNEKIIIEAYLPDQLSEVEISNMIDEAISELDNPGMQAMGQVIGKVKQKAGTSADGAVIARLVKEKLQ